jgi:hypothetical protein
MPEFFAVLPEKNENTIQNQINEKISLNTIDRAGFTDHLIAYHHTVSGLTR